jgi:hypothetical protein
MSGGTLVLLEHRGFERHGPQAVAYRDALASAQGWPWILKHYEAAADQPAHAAERPERAQG